MNEAVARWDIHRERLVADLEDRQAISFLIPSHDHSEWQALKRDEVMRWLQYMHYQAMYVDHRVIASKDQTHVYFKVWEYGEPEPDWGAVIPTRQLNGEN